ncbi:MAG: hypothetical protein GFH27_549319n65 [Chloroflexi bacterium AL-W]|nr:hypothetical protein [Chloroflexi bacterium AL-N1]NOK70611.1 hypothetical protein [Chloroflexi bacterium AL-N10]NOK77603.1 hypothetical protein [Chloroflexi bacterium AL-N5]NOK84454.1 hypothetical protein [Chloroflexi bacterium AL-W]NOK92343.1 hypothetical protein [Chloroflexi bacterium AL-N15]
MVVEQVHSYPRWIRWSIELLCTAIVLVTAFFAGRDILRYLWFVFGFDGTLLEYVPFLPEIVLLLRSGVTEARINELSDLLPSLGWFALGLWFTIFLRNAFPTIRTSSRGALVEFEGGWIPISWEDFRAIKVTEDLAAKRFVLLVETNMKQLTGWHHIYSFLYRLGFRRGFWIISAISDFDALVKTFVDETDRITRIIDNTKPIKVQEEAASPLFQFLLGPTVFFSRQTPAEQGNDEDVPMVSAPSGNSILGAYPQRISSFFHWATIALAIGLGFRYLIYWLEFLGLTFSGLRGLPVFDRLTLLEVQLAAPWWLLVAAHLLAVIMFGILIVFRNLLPAVEARGEGLAVHYANRQYVVPWSKITAIKVTEFSEESQVLLIQTKGHLPATAQMSGLLYNGSLTTGVLVTSALSNFEAFMQRVVLEVTRHQNPSTRDVEAIEDSPIFQSEARSPFFMLSFRAGAGIDYLVEESRRMARGLEMGRVFRAAAPMVLLAIPTAFLSFADRSIDQGLLPNSQLIMSMILLFTLSFIEWPLVSLAAIALDEVTGGGEEGYRPLYLYPIVQLPRLLPLAGALICVLLGIPFLPVLLWFGAIVWSFLLTAGLWESLYDWRGGQLLAGGLVPVVFQLLVLLAYLIALR